MEDRGKTAFVVWMDPAPDDPDEASVYRGRIEHLASATRETFVSKEQLLSFMARALRGKVGDDPGGEA